MTITDVAPAGRSATESAGWDATARPSGDDTGSRRPTTRERSPGIDQRLSTELIATFALTLFSVAVAVGYARVFAGWQFLDNFIVIAVVGHGVGFLLRRVRVPGVVAVPLLALAVAWVIGFVHYRDSYTMLLPTGETLDLFSAEIELVRQQFRTAVAPVIFAGGWDVLAAIGMGLAVVLSDTFAFRAYARAEALVPGGVLFVFIAALGADRDRVGSSMLLVAAGVMATVALRAHHAPVRPSAIGRTRSPVRAVVPGAVFTAVIVALAAGWVGPRLPGADADPIFETRGGQGGSVTEVVSPLVDIRSRLTNRSNSQLFVVQANFESYWRSSALPRFDGTTWGLPERALSRADGELSVARDGADELRQSIRIVNLGGQFVPAAADPIAASPQDGLRWNADSSTLLKTDGELLPGDAFEIVSASPRFDVDALRAATSLDPGDPIYLELPTDFPSSVADLAREVTVGATTSYDAAIILQNWFRTEFDYSLEVQAGHSTNAIESFLRERVGYCEQFAGTYAAMMRALGIPARVAVGFTTGNSIGDQSFSVLGKNAHAWPEVWFDGLGWVPFEPTPGRGAPGAENYTGVAPEQDVSGVDPDAPTESPVPGPDGDGATPPTFSAPPVTRPDPGNILEDMGDPTGAPTGEAPAPGSTGSSRLPLLLVFAAIALVIAAPAAIRRVRRRRSPSDHAGSIAMLWRRALDAVGEVAPRPRASATPLEHAARVSHDFPVVSRPFTTLAGAVTEATYRPEPNAHVDTLDEQDRRRLAEYRQSCRQIERAVNDSIRPIARVRRYFTHLR